MALNEKLKAKLNDLKISEDALEGIAGGTLDENRDILNVLFTKDPKGCEEFLKNWGGDSSHKDPSFEFCDGIEDLLKKNFEAKGMNIDVQFHPEYENGNYCVDGKDMTHDQFINFIKNKL